MSTDLGYLFCLFHIEVFGCWEIKIFDKEVFGHWINQAQKSLEKHVGFGNLLLLLGLTEKIVWLE